jgi:hypothetical protein
MITLASRRASCGKGHVLRADRVVCNRVLTVAGGIEHSDGFSAASGDQPSAIIESAIVTQTNCRGTPILSYLAEDNLDKEEANGPSVQFTFPSLEVC